MGNSKKKLKHKKIIEESLEGYSKGYKHRRHRLNDETKRKRHERLMLENKIKEEQDEEWKKIWINKGEII